MNRTTEKGLQRPTSTSSNAHPTATATASSDNPIPNSKKPSSISYKPKPRVRQQRNSSSSSDKACVVCYRDVKYSSVGPCEHPVCYECSSRMRVLMEQNECPICRQSMDHVIFTQGMKSYAELKDKIRMFVFIPTWSIYLEDESIQASLDKLLEHKCFLCPDQPTFPQFEGLREHIQRRHQLYSCDLCVEHIKHFSKERKFYTRSDLGYHKRKGDRNDTSHRGHPLCQFCDRRFFDNDELFKHLRQDHYFCHFCDADGYNHYYNTYDDLRLHYRKEHFLCEEEHCAEEKFTSVFRTDIDLKAHLAAAHSRLLGKHGTKQARTLEIEFALPKRPENERGRFGRPFGGRGGDGRDHDRGDRERMSRNGRDRGGGGHEKDEFKAEEEILDGEIYQVPTVQPNMDSAIDFPTLGDGPSPSGTPAASINGSSIAQKLALNSGMNVRPSHTWKGGKMTREYDFPALDGSTAPPTNILTPAPQHFGPYGKNRLRPTVDAQQRHKAGGGGREEDFPTLSSIGSEDSTRGGGGKVWTGTGPGSKLKVLRDQELEEQQSSRGQPRVKKVAPCPILMDENGSSDKDFNYVPLSLSSRSSKVNGGGKLVEPAESEPSTMIKNQELLPETNNNDNNGIPTGKKGKKKGQSSGIAMAAAALFNGGIPPTKLSHKPKIPLSTPGSEPAEEFPSLPPPVTKKGGGLPKKSPKAPPPMRTISPPPGFQLRRDEMDESLPADPPLPGPPSSGEKITKPPPGFESVQVQQPSSASSSGGLNFLDSVLEFGEVSIPKTGEYSMYTQPVEMKGRNGRLLEAIKASLNSDETTYQSFLHLSTLFRKNEIPAQEYYDLCQSMFGMMDFRVIFPELLVLLPDIQKQQELLVTHRNCGGKGEVLSTCHICHQVLKKGDVAFHIQSHSNDKEASFPSLTSSGSSNNRKM